jgi:hypothetical protein
MPNKKAGKAAAKFNPLSKNEKTCSDNRKFLNQQQRHYGHLHML